MRIDKPTNAQLNTVFMLIRWSVPTPVAREATEWLAEKASRREVSGEIARLRDLNIKHKLSVLECFTGRIWEGFEYERS